MSLNGITNIRTGKYRTKRCGDIALQQAIITSDDVTQQFLSTVNKGDDILHIVAGNHIAVASFK